MEKRNVKIPTPHQSKFANPNSISSALGAKIVNLQDIVKRTILSSQRYKVLDIFGANELNVCVNSLEAIFSTLKHLLVLIDAAGYAQITSFLKFSLPKISSITIFI